MINSYIRQLHLKYDQENPTLCVFEGSSPLSWTEELKTIKVFLVSKSELAEISLMTLF